MALAIPLALILPSYFLLKNILLAQLVGERSGQNCSEEAERSEEQSARAAPPRTTSNYF
ncbi:hypothetical protein [Paenibacillus sp. S02]|uniref:hypothetical protein n=1 Tax=Paenibacillus sp. S02 TaxID=2823904 RepID=UPI001C653BC7|nr:hypothetical protein [Paenibacillus sp. S02]